MMMLERALAFLALVCAAQSISDGFSQDTLKILTGYQSGVDSVRRTGKQLHDMLDNAVPLSEEKVAEEYSKRLTSYWEQNLDDAQGTAQRKGVDASECLTDSPIPGIIRQVVLEAQQCVRDKVPELAKRVQAHIDDLYAACDQFMLRAEEKARYCEKMSGWDRMMCVATRLGTMGGHIGGLGGQAGGIGGETAGVIDGTARECTIDAAEKYDVQAKTFVASATSCIYKKCA